MIAVSFVLLLKGVHRAAKWLLGCTTVIMLLIALFPVGDWMLSPLETRFETNPELPEKLDGIIVLSGGEACVLSELWDQVELWQAAERSLGFMALARKYPQARLVFTGGTGSLLSQEYKAADVAKRLYEEQGMDVSKIHFERNARNTYENAIFTRKEINPLPGETWVLITTAWHMPRSVGIFCKAGWPVIPYPVDHWTEPGNLVRIDFNFSGHLKTLTAAFKEWVGLVVYYLTGKTTGVFPGLCE